MQIGHKPKKVTCPRCGLKVIEGTPVCEDCGLVFARLLSATNADAKRKKKRGERDFILKTTILPSDVKWWKLLLMTIFTGLAGGHHFYVGRYLRGAINLSVFIIAILCVVFNSYMVTFYPTWLELIGALIVGPLVISWLVDIWLVTIRKYKVPIAIDLKEKSTDEIIAEK